MTDESRNNNNNNTENALSAIITTEYELDLSFTLFDLNMLAIGPSSSLIFSGQQNNES